AGSFVGISNLAAFTAGNGIQLSSPHSVVLALDQIHFADRGQGESNNFATFRIDLQTAPVPEPATAALAIIGLVAMGMSRQLRRA
ncbi:PEP-CTERM sorting domain-containing protein, partial [Escherichia coli]|uniref:PEP-CTERM sorting domain-containing protein n=1 Tax=Escherichia coli TaxID=562 RepID=UPI00159BC98C